MVYRSVISAFALLTSFSILCLGHGLQSVLLPARATLAQYSTFVIGALMSCYYAGFIGGTFLCPWLINRVGHIRVFAAAAAGAAIIMEAHSLTMNPAAWLTLRIIYGLCMVHLYTVMESWLSSISGKEQRGRILSIYMIINFTSMTGGQLLFFLAPAEDFRLFVCSSMLLSMSLLPLILSRITSPATVSTPEGLSVRRLIRISPLGTAGALAAGLAGSAFWGLAADFILRMGFSQDNVAWFMAASLIGGLLAQWPLGSFSDHTDRRYAILIASGMICLSSLVLALMGLHDMPARFYGTWWLIIWGGLFGVGLHPLYSLCIAHTNDFLAPEYFVRASAGLQRIQSSGAIAGPLITGALMSAGNFMLFLTIALLAAGLAIFALTRLMQGRKPHHLFRRPFRLLTRTGPLALLLDPRSRHKDNPGSYG